jgi:hypothetical protein
MKYAMAITLQAPHTFPTAKQDICMNHLDWVWGRLQHGRPSHTYTRRFEEGGSDVHAIALQPSQGATPEWGPPQVDAATTLEQWHRIQL